MSQTKSAPRRPSLSPAQIRSKILDAAADCLVDGGFASGRLLSAVARRAGLSRPTLYKYGGTIDDIKQALFERELAAFLDALAPRLRALTWTVDGIADLLVFIVGYARGHTLLNAALRDVPELALPIFTLQAEGPIRLITQVAEPIVRERIDAGTLPPHDIPVLTEVLFRIAISTVLIRSDMDFDDPDVLRDYLRTTISFAAGLPAS
ncbi:TetR/AcrR family transcriptional regulator [Actinomadura sp. WMMB 499]|uniref:TetR/AcrR family transcriptional regulator n=1 Tax=Actinomadura sp. WMMB 499 TaxID=1219491 RepID=UPI0012462DBC|nr:TetR/AcrR family transcriptional regulator [Actinomadura sp. WMMB 499]QFG21145.1 TetR/AcrR family transcriptional regulator [Actinomadura sp. WMMB 499]